MSSLPSPLQLKFSDYLLHLLSYSDHRIPLRFSEADGFLFCILLRMCVRQLRAPLPRLRLPLQLELNPNSDIFMYRLGGNKPFCSQECRQEQIEIDEADEKKRRVSSSKRSSTVRQTSESSKESDTNKAVRTGTVAVA